MLIAVQQGHLSVVSCLLEAGAAVNRGSRAGGRRWF